ncbi:SMP-30/gluconolactonase/LRE family protein [Novosphingobium aquae]|uniref:SMP-30/gluconolactonase/LRE family protein n=1 Tax=Novosphingobium aquae TaxID=3133435 RepID=A0ABU8SD64_9SPHN
MQTTASPRPDVLVETGRGLRFTESPRWHKNRLWFLDIHDSAIKAVDLSGALETIVALPFKPNGFGFLPDGSVLVGDALNLQVMHWDGADLRLHADLRDTAVFCLSDGVVDARGRIYVGDIGYNFWDLAAAPVNSCVIARIDPDGTVHKVASGLSFPNGMVITPDGKTLIVAETNAHRLTAYTIAEEGSLTDRRVFAQFDQSVQPDGICLDAEGAVWLANPAGQPSLLRVRQGGEVTDRIALEIHAYAVMLGGPERRHLFICTSASHDPAQIAQDPSAALLVMDVAVPGAGIP